VNLFKNSEKGEKSITIAGIDQTVFSVTASPPTCSACLVGKTDAFNRSSLKYNYNFLISNTLMMKFLVVETQSQQITENISN